MEERIVRPKRTITDVIDFAVPAFMPLLGLASKDSRDCLRILKDSERNLYVAATVFRDEVKRTIQDYFGDRRTREYDDLVKSLEEEAGVRIDAYWDGAAAGSDVVEGFSAGMRLALEAIGRVAPREHVVVRTLEKGIYDHIATLGLPFSDNPNICRVLYGQIRRADAPTLGLPEPDRA